MKIDDPQSRSNGRDIQYCGLTPSGDVGAEGVCVRETEHHRMTWKNRVMATGQR